MSNHFNWLLLLPELVLTAGGVVILLLEAIATSLRRSFTALAVLATLGAGYAAYYVTPLHHVVAGRDGTFNGLIETSPLTLTFTLIVLLATVISLLASQSYLRREGILGGEYHALLLWCAVGLLLMLRATELLTVFLALETLSLCLYCLAAFHRRISISSEAAIKYFLMGAFVSAFALYGIALIYGGTGSTHFEGIVHALVQRDIKRMLAYSGVAHMGYLLLALVVMDRASLVPVVVYLLAYVLMNAGAFTVVSLLYSRPGEQHLISDLGGWGYRYPLIGGCLAVCMLSLGGIPPTLGFLGKYVVFLNAVGDGLVGLAVVGVLASLVGVFYYLRVA